MGSILDLVPEYDTWSGILFYSIVFYLLITVASVLLSPFLKPVIPEKYKK
jgi:hypothetical protein